MMFDPNDSNDETIFTGGVTGGLFKNTNISNGDYGTGFYMFGQFGC